MPGTVRRVLAVTGHRSSRVGAGALALVMTLALVGTASASILERLPLEQLQAKADAVLIGRVLSSRSVFSGRTIRTETVLAIERSFRGPGSGTVRVLVVGGAVGGRRLVVRGAPSFATGERVLVFLHRVADGWRPVGMFQGVWRLGPEETGMARPSAAGGAMLVALRPGPYAVDGRPRSIAELVGGVSGGG